MPPANFQSHPAPISDYAAAVAKVQAMQAAESAAPGFNPALHSLLLTHGQKTRRAVLWFHGYTAATLQFGPLAELCNSQGCNALVPCMPHHGFQDRLSPEISRIKARELVRFADEMIDLMHGLGEEIIVGGLSMGGALAAWAAQQRSDVALALIIAPFLGARRIPTRQTWAFAHLTQFLPDKRQWWDPEQKETAPGSGYGYLQYSSRSLGQILQVGGYPCFGGCPPAAACNWKNLAGDQRSRPLREQ